MDSSAQRGEAGTDLESLIHRHQNAVYRQMVRVCGSREDAEDALADALVTALRAAGQLRDPANFQAWLARIGTRACARMRIRERISRSVPLGDLEALGFEIADPAPDPLDAAQMATMKQCVTGAVDSLPSIYREVYVRREIEGRSAEEVSNALQISIPALKSRLHRARSLMREALDSGFGCRDLLDS